jgi:hypothetical protein
VNDPTLVDPFINRMNITVGPAQNAPKTTGHKGRAPTKKEGNSRELPTGLDLPDIEEIDESGWAGRKHPFDRYSALEIVQDDAADADATDNGNTAQYSFYVNMDNIYYKTAAKASKQNVGIIKTQWIGGLTLLGIALIQSQAKMRHPENILSESADDGDVVSFEEHVFDITSAIAPVLLPLIESLGSITEEQVDDASSNAVGED